MAKLSEITIETLTAYIPADRRHALMTRSTLPDRSTGAALFADISGFTQLAELLAKEFGPQRGAEELISQLNTVYGALIGEVQRYRGSVIGFSGDAITCWFDGDNGLHAIASGFAMQQKMSELSAAQGPVQNAPQLAIKVAVASGPIRRFLPGDPEIQVIDVLAGSTLEQMIAAEHVAEKGEITVTERVADELNNQLIVQSWRENVNSGGRYAVVSGLTQQVASNAWPQFEPGSLAEADVRPWLLRPVYERLRSSQRDFLAELRPAVSLFLKFTGIDYDHDADAGVKLNTFIRWVQGILTRYEGSLIQLTIGDKGSYFYAAFGAPIAHDDDSLRALAAAQALRQPPAALHFIQGIRIGIAQGRMFAGAYGSETRRTYGVIGDKTNLAARLMSVAPPGQIRCDYEVYNSAKTRWTIQTLPSVRVKGKAGLVRVYEPIRETVKAWQASQNTLFGRRQELAQLEAALQVVNQGGSQIIVIEGEAGIGKSRMVAELIRQARELGISGLVGAGQSIEQQTAYRVWRDLLSTYFGLGEVTDPAERQTRIINLVTEIAPYQLQRLPLINDILNAGLPDTELTAALDPAQRQQSLVVLLLNLLRTWTAERPLMLILEDVHWLDSLSWDVTVQIARAMVAAGDRLLLVLTTRAVEEHSLGAQLLASLKELDVTETLSLNSLSSDDILGLVTARLGLPPDGLPSTVGEFVSQRCSGNPFFAEEIILTLRDQGLIDIELAPEAPPEDPYYHCIVRGNFTEASATLPDTLHGLLLSRIDRLPPDHKLTLKVAAVIGRTFAYPTLQYILSTYATSVDLALREQLSNLVQRDFTVLETREPDLSYIFKHIITQETAYQTLLFSQRRQLHRMAAQWYETTFGRRSRDPQTSPLSESLAPFYPLLVHHYHHAEDFDQERFFARQAGEQAASQFANAEAVRYLSRALELTDPADTTEHYEILLAREKVYDLLGQREAQEQDIQTLKSLAESLSDDEKQAQVAARLARYAISVGDYPLTITTAQEIIPLAQNCKSTRLEATGFFYWGRALWHQGEYEQSSMQLNQAIALAQAAEARDVEADSLLALGLVAWHQSDFEGANRFFEQALSIFHAIGSRGGEAMAYNNLGIISAITGVFANALEHFEQCLRISQEMGGRRNEAMALTNLGNIAAMTQDNVRATAYFEQVVVISREIGDRQVEASSQGNLGVIFDRQGDYARAEPSFSQALAICRAIGDRRNEAMVQSNMSLFSHHLGNQDAAQSYSQEALAAAEELKDTHLKGEALTYRGHALAAIGAFKEAYESYQQANNLRRDLGELPLAMESMAGLARCSLAQDRPTQALVEVEEILDYLSDNSLDGAEEPLRVYLTCYDVLEANQDSRAHSMLQTAFDLLTTTADQISDVRVRQKFLENVAVHRDIRARYHKVFEAGESLP